MDSLTTPRCSLPDFGKPLYEHQCCHFYKKQLFHSRFTPTLSHIVYNTFAIIRDKPQSLTTVNNCKEPHLRNSAFLTNLLTVVDGSVFKQPMVMLFFRLRFLFSQGTGVTEDGVIIQGWLLQFIYLLYCFHQYKSKNKGEDRWFILKNWCNYDKRLV